MDTDSQMHLEFVTTATINYSTLKHTKPSQLFRVRDWICKGAARRCTAKPMHACPQFPTRRMPWIPCATSVLPDCCSDPYTETCEWWKLGSEIRHSGRRGRPCMARRHSDNDCDCACCKTKGCQVGMPTPLRHACTTFNEANTQQETGAVALGACGCALVTRVTVCMRVCMSVMLGRARCMIMKSAQWC